MQRRTFLQLLGIASLQGLLPAVSAATPTPTATPPAHPIGQFFCIDMAGTRVHPAMAQHLATIQPAGFSIFGGNSKAAPRVIARFIADLRTAQAQRTNAPFLVMVDQESSKVARLRFRLTDPPNFTSLGRELQWILDLADPSTYPDTRDALQTQFDRYLALTRQQRDLQTFADKVTQWGKTVGQEMADLGIDALYAPVLDRAGSELLDQRAISAHPVLIALVAYWYLQGLRASGMNAIAKHAPGLGGAAAGVADPHLTQLAVQVNDAELFPFWLLHQAGLLAGFMVTHVTPSSIRLSGVTEADAAAVLKAQRPASVSAPFIALMRQYLGTDMPFLTDGLGMQGLQTFVGGDTAKAVLLTLLAGLDLAVTDPPTLDSVQLQAYQACAAALANMPANPPTTTLQPASIESLYQKVLAAPTIPSLAQQLTPSELRIFATRLQQARSRWATLRRQPAA